MYLVFLVGWVDLPCCYTLSRHAQECRAVLVALHLSLKGNAACLGNRKFLLDNTIIKNYCCVHTQNSTTREHLQCSTRLELSGGRCCVCPPLANRCRDPRSIFGNTSSVSRTPRTHLVSLRCTIIFVRFSRNGAASPLSR